MNTIASSSSSSKFPRSTGAWQRSDKVLDVLLPRYYESDLEDFYDNKPPEPTFRQDDPELTMGDDGDAMYAETLLNSDFLSWLNKDDACATTAQPSSRSWTALDRLRMLVAHTTAPSIMLLPLPLSPDPPASPSTFRSSSAVSASALPNQQLTIHPSQHSIVDQKGKGKSRQ
ncbi:hypothetical protein BX666DRAFT_2028004 [Dichotomocladium elegans]|nr:hypothetical protein BX666DRAFT_2028004 [Dichotomocladium elegans]